MTELADADHTAREVIRRIMTPPPPLDFNAWAERNIVFSAGESPFPGPYRRQTNPPIERILECLSPEHPARTVALKASIQIFKTTIAQIFVGASMDLDPGPILYTLPTHDNALRWARTKWAPMRRGSEALKRIFGENKSRDTADTLFYQERKDGRGWLQISGANSEASLAMISVPRQVQDDLAKWDQNEAGDPERQADGRSSAFDWAKIFKISSPRVAKTCRISRAFKAGTQERWHVPCPHCDHYQPLEWANFAATLDRLDPASAHFTCVSCNQPIEHRHKLHIVALGKWVADNPTAKDPSFHIWRAYAPTRDWESIAREWFAAEGDPANEQVFFNEVLALEYELASEAPPWEDIRDRANKSDYIRGRVPDGAIVICIGVDCQGDRTECHIKGFGKNLQRWTIDYQVIPFHIATADCRNELDKLLKTTFQDNHGMARGVDMMAIDGNAWTNDVFHYVKERGHGYSKVIIVRGIGSDGAPPLALTKTQKRADGKSVISQKRFYNVGVSGLKSSFYEHLKKHDQAARGFCGYPRGLSDEFYRQMTAERREIIVDKYGFPRPVWRLHHDRNEVLDTEMYAEAAAIRCGFYTRTPEAWDNIIAMRREPEPQPHVPKPPPSLLSQAAHPASYQPPAPPAPSRVRRSQWMG